MRVFCPTRINLKNIKSQKVIYVIIKLVNYTTFDIVSLLLLNRMIPYAFVSWSSTVHVLGSQLSSRVLSYGIALSSADFSCSFSGRPQPHLQKIKSQTIINIIFLFLKRKFPYIPFSFGIYRLQRDFLI